MILHGNQRGGAGDLATHLLNDRDNDHVCVHELRGFVADDLHGALAEADAISRGTRCRQFLFSLSLNPPKDAFCGEEDFERAADHAERVLGLEGQPRAIVIHEKEGRRHAHVVWSRIDADELKAINLAFYKRKLTDLSRELFLEHDWTLPEGLRSMGSKSPLNFTLEEWQQAKRAGLDPREIKQVFQQAYKHSDSLKAFGAALEQSGYFIAKGDRRGFVALDVEGNVYSLPRYLGIKTSAFRKRMGNGDDLAPLALVSADLNKKVTAQLTDYLAQGKQRQRDQMQPLRDRAAHITAEHRKERQHLAAKQAQRQRDETAERARNFRSGLAGLWDRITGKARAITAANEADALRALERDRRQRDALALAQLEERSAVQRAIDQLRLRHREDRKLLTREVITHLHRLRQPTPEQSLDQTHGRDRERRRRRPFSLDL